MRVTTSETAPAMDGAPSSPPPRGIPPGTAGAPPPCGRKGRFPARVLRRLRGLARLARAEAAAWAQEFLTAVPGETGVALRGVYLRRRLASLGEGCRIGA